MSCGLNWERSYWVRIKIRVKVRVRVRVGVLDAAIFLVKSYFCWFLATVDMAIIRCCLHCVFMSCLDVFLV